MASSSQQAICNRRGRMIHVSAAIIPKGTIIGKDKITGKDIKALENMVAKGRTYRKEKSNAN